MSVAITVHDAGRERPTDLCPVCAGRITELFFRVKLREGRPGADFHHACLLDLEGEILRLLGHASTKRIVRLWHESQQQRAAV